MINLLKRVAGLIYLFIQDLILKLLMARLLIFILPKSTLVMLVSAFSTRENVLNAYKTAVNLEYRFFSFGDAMLII